MKGIGKNVIDRLKETQNQENWIFCSGKPLMKKRREISRNSKCIEQQIASGSALRIFLSPFKRYQRKTLSYSKRTLRTHHSISKKLISYGQNKLELITG